MKDFVVRAESVSFFGSCHSSARVTEARPNRDAACRISLSVSWVAEITDFLSLPLPSLNQTAAKKND